MEVEDRRTHASRAICKRSSQLCNFCGELFHLKLAFQGLGVGYLDEDEKPYQSMKEFQQAVLDGCHLCFLFWHYLSSSLKASVEDSEWVEYNIIGRVTEDDTAPVIEGLQLMFKLPHDGPPLGWSELMLLVPTTDLQSSTTGISTEISDSSDSQKTFDITIRWLEECSEKHIICKKLAPTEAFLPTRLLDIGGQDDDPISLCLSEKLDGRTKYMTLSHCWGGIAPLTLTSATLVKFLERISYPELPKTFREAIQITRRLGIRYLWIDSLCIIQRSSEDWKREAAMMSEVYRHSWCNIAATKAQDGRGGCFDKRNPLLVSPCEVLTTWPGKPQQAYYCVPDGIWSTQIDECPLSSRAWVFQEIMLSPRVLHYGKGQVFWECCELRACESHPGGSEITLHEGTKISTDPHNIQEDHKRQFKRTPPSHDRYYMWDSAIHQYSKRDLTFPEKDIFYAISGIARLLIPENEYLAGLWNSPETLSEQLLWHTRLDSAAIRSRLYRAPSWSWASLDSDGMDHVGFEVIEEHLSSTHDLIKVLEAEVILEDPADPYGPVTDGHIYLQGTVVHSTISLQGRSGTNLCLFGKIQMSLNHDFGELREGSTVHCLPVRLDTSEENYELGSFDHIHGLIVEPTKLRDHEYYRRGYFRVENEDPYEEEEYSANVLRFWNMLLHGPIDSKKKEAEMEGLTVEDVQAKWINIHLI